MILTPIAPDRLRRTLAAFAAALENETARRIFRCIAVPAHAARASGRDAAAHHREALALAASLGMGIRPDRGRAVYGWDGRALAPRTEAYVLLHEVAHYQLASPNRRRRIEFGLGPGPDTADLTGAARHSLRLGIEREHEEATASLLGILWEVELGQPALASFLDQNWLEGVPRPGPARHFTAVLRCLQGDGFVTATGRPTRRLRHAADKET